MKIFKKTLTHPSSLKKFKVPIFNSIFLRWKNISGNVHYLYGSTTSISESAGSASVAFHLLSPGSRSYFSQAILQSAAATNPWAMVTKREAKVRARRLAEVLKCPYEDVSLFPSCTHLAMSVSNACTKIHS